jgi:hypothetical protein
MSNATDTLQLRKLFADRIANAISNADTLLSYGGNVVYLELALKQAYRDTALLALAHSPSIARHREQMHNTIDADQTLNPAAKEIFKFKATFIILQDAVNGDLPKLMNDSVDNAYLIQLNAQLRANEHGAIYFSGDLSM